MTTEDTHIAVVGMAGRFPGAGDLDEFWVNLAKGVESLRRFTREELLDAGEDPRRLDDPGYVPVQGVLEDATCFDARLFGYSPREARLIDPQQRVFLECAWHALEDAGYDPRNYDGAIGVYAGCSPSTYAYRIWQDGTAGMSSLDEYSVSIATAPDHLVSRVSYKLGLTGPSVTVMTTCSTSLVAIHQAAQSLLGGECDIAIAGGSSVDIPARGYLYREGGTLSPDGHVRAFDAASAGMVGADGVGAVVLKRLDEALAGGDRVRAVLRASAVGNLGADRAGYTAPSVAGQASVIQTALTLAGVRAESIGYVETHGTGTRVGDPIELAALTRVFRTDTDRAGFCAVGSVKTNIGHTDAAAGVASFIKAVLALEHRQIPPSLHFRRANPEIDFDTSPFFVNTELRDWHTNGTPRRAGVSSFGLGGTNAHAILEEAPARLPAGPGRSRQLLVLSAASPEALDTMTGNLAAHLRDGDEELADVGYTLQVGRQALAYRRYLVCADRAEAVEILENRRPGPAGAARGRPVVFLFPGQGAQHVGMARSLYDQIPSFRAEVDHCAGELTESLGTDLRELLYGTGDARRLEPTALAQPALFTIEYALARMFLAWGVSPNAMIGHSIGELVAACLAGVFTLPDALRLSAQRGRLVQDLPDGAMLAVPLPEARLRDLLTEDLSIAAVNGADRCVVSGPRAAVDAVAARLVAMSVPSTRLRTSHAFHSAMMDPAAPAFARLVSTVDRQAPAIPYASNVTGDWITAEQATDPGYWARHLRSTVRFQHGLATVLATGDPLLVELGPGQALTALARRAGATAIPTLHRADRSGDDLATVLTALGEVWVSGNRVDWTAVRAGESRRRVRAPLYPFERVEHVLPSLRSSAAPRSAMPQTPARPTETHPAPGPELPVRDRIAALFGDVLGMTEVAGDADFFELGGDSLTATQLIARTRDAFSVAVPLDSVFDHPTPAEFSDAVSRLLAGDLKGGAV